MFAKLSRRYSEEWVNAAEFAREQYRSRYRADTVPDPDSFVVARVGEAEPTGSTHRDRSDGAAGIVGCAGLTFHSGVPFFSECYLDAPVEAAASGSLGLSIDRDRVVEVGPLASAGHGYGTELIRLVPILAWCQGMSHILCTVPPALERSMNRLDIRFQPLAPANEDRIPRDQQGRWGTYYDQSPRTGIIALDALMPLFQNCTGRYLFNEITVSSFGSGHQEGGYSYARR
ncbi:hypothetical protein GCM10027570_07850 [Streptomonospora sediminis]